jgi:hypothetical protein
VYQEEMTIVNLHEPNISEPNFIKHIQLDFKTQMNPSIEKVGDFNIPLSQIDSSSSQKH